MTVPSSASGSWSGSLRAGGFGGGTYGMARTGGTGGRRDGENIGRALVSINTPRGIAHKGFPLNELFFGMAVVGVKLTDL